MSEQAKILEELQTIIMHILKNGSASVEEGERIEELEHLLHQQKCYQKIIHDEYEYQGEEIAGLFSQNHYDKAIEKMYQCQITPNDFFGFIFYHDEDEVFSDLFTDSFISEINKIYQAKYLLN